VMVHVIDELEQAGYVVRERNASDRRAYLLRATPAGEELLRSAGPTLLAADANAARRLSADQQPRLRALLEKLLGPDLPEVAAPVSQTLGYLIARAHFKLHASANERLVPLGLDIREYGALQTIADLGPCAQQQVATLLGVSGPVVVELIDALEPRGLVVRERNPDDRRSYALRLTADGEQLRHAARATLNETDHPLDAAERDRLSELLRVMLGAGA